MLLGTLFAMVAAMFVGVPLLPVLLVGALLQATLAFGLTKNMACVNLGVGLVMVVLAGYVLVPMLGKNLPEGKAIVEVVQVAVPYINAFAAILTLVGSTLIGLRRPVAP
ncbi:hypothetical protein [Duganella vulcania]|uniref:Uncharacterized protein n=1 Tax=Duganella vulcania TaxID=2692166 RepID=A0A845GGG6_9BURK|nr:hypothetical protein [Duganella vulcania]MYM92336.1 hypothetical protein [Duganella vulcania]